MNELYGRALDIDSICDPVFIKRKFPKYKKPYEIAPHIKTSLNEFKHLSAYKRECVVDGELYVMINLEGTVSVVYKGNIYNIPLRVMLREDYPASAPIIYVTPTQNMIFGKNVPYVSSRGKITIPYLENWEREQNPDLYKILHQLCILFADNPPVWTKRTNDMVKAIESRYQRHKPKNVIVKESRQESRPSTPGGTRQRQSIYTSRGHSISDPSQCVSASLALQTERSLSGLGTPYKDSADSSPESSTHYKSVAYESQSSGGSSSATPSPSQTPFGEGFIPFDPAQAVSTPGSFVPAFNYNDDDDNNRNNNNKIKNSSSNDDTAMEHRHVQPASTSAEGNLSRSQSVPLDLSQQKSRGVLATYRRRKMIGSGGFAKVFLYENENTGEKVACKIVELGDNDQEVQKCADALKKEIKILKTLKHDFIISYLSTEEYNNNLAMIMEYFPKGSLYSELQRRPERCFDEPTTRFFTWQIIQGVKFLHENCVIHRDIKARNILINDSDIIKIADFGISKKMDALVTATTASKDNFASIYWQSPEYLRGDGKYGRKTDVWSIGCTVVEMLVGKPPLQCDDITTKGAAGLRILKNEVYPPESCSEIAKDFLEHCFRPQEERPTSSELMQKTEFPSPHV